MFQEEEQQTQESLSEDEEEVEEEESDDLPDLEQEDDLPPEEVNETKIDEKFRADIEKTFGLPLEDLQMGIKYIKNLVASQQLDKSLSTLDKFWGTDRAETESRMTRVQAYWKKMPKEKQALYNSEEGAQIIWATLSKKDKAEGKTSIAKGSTNSKGRKIMFTTQQIEDMSSADYDKNIDRITYAYENNLVGT